MKFDIDPQIYNEINGGQYQDAKELLEKIRADGIDSAPVIVDIGCGSGNVTALLGKAIQHDRIVSFDIIPEMVDFAQKNSSSTKVEFFVEDISKPWEDLHATLRSLEGQVDLVWSNRVFHWVPAEKRPQAAANIMRLLKPGGSFYLTITSIPNFNELLSPEERERNEKLIKIPTVKEQEGSWRKIFTSVGLSPVSAVYVPKQWPFRTKEQFQENKNCITVLTPFLTEAVPVDQRSAVLDSFVELFLRGLATPFGEPIVDKNFIENCVVENYGLIVAVGGKP